MGMCQTKSEHHTNGQFEIECSSFEDTLRTVCERAKPKALNFSKLKEANNDLFTKMADLEIDLSETTVTQQKI